MKRAVLLAAALMEACGPDFGARLSGTARPVVVLETETDAGTIVLLPDDPRAAFDPDEVFPAGAHTGPTRSVEALKVSLTPATTMWRSDFVLGQALFEVPWEVAPGTHAQRDGLGPLFNATSCTACHPGSARGLIRSGDDAASSLLVRVSRAGAQDPSMGLQLQPSAIPGVESEGRVTLQFELNDEGLERPIAVRIPSFDDDTEWSLRMSPGLQGMGLLEAIDVEVLNDFADPDDLDHDGISGRLAVLPNGDIGRFGWKALHASVRSQAAGALSEDMGLTTSLHPDQTCTSSQLACLAVPNGGSPEVPDGVLAPLVTHVRMLNVPPRIDAEDVLEGKRLFFKLGCESCHRAALRTSAAATPIELADQRIWPWTDLLLHDLGEGLADGRPEGAATGREWRTPPLWSLSLSSSRTGEGLRLLHDGRARTWNEAILWHGGEALLARERWKTLDAEAQSHVERFLESL